MLIRQYIFNVKLPAYSDIAFGRFWAFVVVVVVDVMQ